MRWRRFLQVLLEPAKDPLRDSFGISIERVRALRIRLNEQLAGLRSRTGSLEDPAFTIQIEELQAEHDRLVELERRGGGENHTPPAPPARARARLTARPPP